jgi:chromatin modification-related protein VID21
MRTDFKEERKWKIANAYILSMAVMEWHNAEDKSTVCIKTREPIFLDNVLEETTIKENIEQSVEEPSSILKSDVEMTEPAVIQTESNDLVADDDEEEEEEEEEEAQHVSNQIKTEYCQLIQSLNPDQAIFTLMDDSHDLISLFPDLLLYTAPDPNCIGNDPYFDEAEYSRIVPFKLSTQRIVLHHHPQKQSTRVSRKRKYVGGDATILPAEEHVEQDQVEGEHLPQVSRRSILYVILHNLYTNGGD